MTKIERVLALDIGGGTTKMGIVDVANRELHYRDSFPTPSSQQDLANLVRRYSQGKEFQGFGVSVPGDVNREFCRIKKLVNLPQFDCMYVNDLLSESLPVALENDANCVAIAEYRERSTKYAKIGEMDSLVALSIGTGVGAGIILRGELYTGRHGNGGEVGHMIIDFKRGKTFEQLCAEHDARDDELAKIVGIGIANIVCAFDIHHIVLGGGKGTRLNFEKVKEEAAKHIVYPAPEGIWIRESYAGENAQLLGAAYNVSKFAGK